MKAPILAPQHSKINGLSPPPSLVSTLQFCAYGTEKEDGFIVSLCCEQSLGCPSKSITQEGPWGERCAIHKAATNTNQLPDGIFFLMKGKEIKELISN